MSIETADLICNELAARATAMQEAGRELEAEILGGMQYLSMVMLALAKAQIEDREAPEYVHIEPLKEEAPKHWDKMLVLKMRPGERGLRSVCRHECKTPLEIDLFECAFRALEEAQITTKERDEALKHLRDIVTKAVHHADVGPLRPRNPYSDAVQAAADWLKEHDAKQGQ